MSFDLKDLERVHRMVRQLLRSDYDREGISAEIICEAIIKGVEHISREHIRHRCTNSFRRRQTEVKANERYLKGQGPTSSSDDVVMREDWVDSLIQILSLDERKVVFLIFYQGLTPQEAAKELSKKESDVRLTLDRALYKMRQV